MSDWRWSVNGERMFVKGANFGPCRRELGEVDGADLRRDVSLARDVGLDLVRVHGHISRPELYEAADELGMLVWQDFPLQWGYARQIRRRAVSQVREAVDLLAHHPSIALWCGHNEPFRVASTDGEPPEQERVRRRSGLGQQVPSWNRSILDRWVKRAFERSDDSRPIVAHSGVLPHAPQLNGTDSHLFFGWYQGDERDLGALAATMPRIVRFVGEFGAPSGADHRRVPGPAALAGAGLGAPRTPPLPTSAPPSRRAYRPTATPPTTPGAWPPSSTRPTCCATRSRPCGA